MNGFEPKPFQKELIDHLAKKEITKRRNRFIYGVDMAEKGGDRSVITRAKINGKGEITQIVFDEYADMPIHKWWRNPIKWWKWRKLWKQIDKSYERAR